MKTYNWVTLGCGVIANQLASAMQQEGRSLYGVGAEYDLYRTGEETGKERAGALCGGRADIEGKNRGTLCIGRFRKEIRRRYELREFYR